MLTAVDVDDGNVVDRRGVGEEQMFATSSYSDKVYLLPGKDHQTSGGSQTRSLLPELTVNGSVQG